MHRRGVAKGGSLVADVHKMEQQERQGHRADGRNLQPLHTSNIIPGIGNTLGQSRTRKDQYAPLPNVSIDLATRQPSPLRPRMRGGELLNKVRRPAPAADILERKKRAEQRNNIRLV